MGFGWFLTGYFFVSVVSLYSPLSFAMLAGYLLIMLGLWKLAPYYRYFKTVFYATFLSLPFAVYYALYGLGKMGFSSPMWLFEGALWQTVEWLYFAFTLVFTMLWLFGVMGLCRELSLQKQQAGAMRNILLIGVTYLFDMISRLPVSFIASRQMYFLIPVLLMRIITVFLNEFLIYGCYRYICPESENQKNERQMKI